MGSTRCSGQLEPWSEGLRGRPAVPGKSCPCTSSRGVHQLSRTSRDRVRGLAGSTRCPGLPGPSPSARGVDHQYWVTRAQALARGVTQGRPAVPCDLGPSLRARGVDQAFWATLAQVRGPAGSTSCPVRFRPVSEGPWVRLAFPGDSVSGPMARRVDLLSRANRAHAWGLTVSTRCPGGLVPGTEGLGVDLLFLETRARSLGPAGTTICPGDSGPCPRAHRDDQLSWENHT